jgi:hypothetical protein
MRSGRLFLPTGIHEALLAMVEDNQNPYFNVEIQAVSKEGGLGYEYNVAYMEPPKVSEIMRLGLSNVEQRRAKLLASRGNPAALAGPSQPVLTLTTPQ